VYVPCLWALYCCVSLAMRWVACVKCVEGVRCSCWCIACGYRCVYNNALKDSVGQNTTGLLAGCSYGFNGTTCFGLLGGHHQVYRC
jgi:hypothetical protein